MNEIKVLVPKYIPEDGFTINWADNAEVEVKVEGRDVLIFGNQAGLTSLAELLLNLSQVEVPKGHHIHLDSYNSLDEGSNSMIIGKKIE